MGRDKAWLELDGRPLLAWVVERLAIRCAPIVIAGHESRALPDIPGTTRIDDPPGAAGPLVGVHAALSWLEARGSTRAYLSSCDAAGLSDAHVERMLAELERFPSAIAAVPIEPDGRRHPLAAALRVSPMRARAAAQLVAGDGRLQTLFTGSDVLEIPVAQLPDPEVLAPCNTPEEWAMLLGRLTRSPSAGRS
jgi:molybdopterin-guanine dinucleotide biosynthesis protein A